MEAQQLELFNEQIPKFKVYTRKGDKGQTSLFAGSRVSKSNPRINALGNVDELNSFIGLTKQYFLVEQIPQHSFEQLEQIQNFLLDVGSHVATPQESATETKIKKTDFPEGRATILEKWIDEMTDELPPLTTFILPGGGLAASTSQICRSVCRRAERSLIPFFEENQISESVIQFINRLSDYFFTLARYCTIKTNHQDISRTKKT